MTDTKQTCSDEIVEALQKHKKKACLYVVLENIKCYYSETRRGYVTSVSLEKVPCKFIDEYDRPIVFASKFQKKTDKTDLAYEKKEGPLQVRHSDPRKFFEGRKEPGKDGKVKLCDRRDQNHMRREKKVAKS
ncbi:unnamed protein product [Orchesella dallaii]|uniref:Uncharacterized protein n=1 Tax=Orchesella dallaii TaxID=48710 RepID=A0ABP1S2M0_9HEXA